MMELGKHKEEFEKIVKKYDLTEEGTAQDIANFLTSQSVVSYEEFAKKFGMDSEDAKIFLSFIHKGIQFKEEHIDPNNK